MTLIARREAAAGRGGAVAAEEEGVGGKEAFRLLRESRHLQIIALVIAFAAVGAGLIEQQLNMAAEAFKGRSATDNLTEFLAQVTLYLSAIGFFIQVALTSRIHRTLGVGFALLVLPMSLGATGIVMLLNAALWAPALARILDTSLRYTLDKTTREVLFLPLPTALKYRAKPFVDVTVDRFAKGLAALLALVLIKPWGLGLNWQQISYASLAVMALWVVTAVRARREYLATFRRSIERREVAASAARPDLADPATVEALVEQLAHPDEGRVLYAIDLLEALNRRRLVTPLLLHHESARVRVRALQALEAARPELRERWAGAVERLLKDASAEVRAAAVHALAAIRGEGAFELMRRYLDDHDPRVATTAAAILAGSAREEDVAAAEAALERLAADTRETAAENRRLVAAALGGIGGTRFRSRLVPLMFDPDPAVAREAIRSAGRGGGAEDLLVPALVSLLRHRSLHDAARDVLVGRGEGVVGALGHFLAEEAEDLEVRRRIPATLARIPSQKSVDLLLSSLGQEDETLRDQVLAALERLRRERPALAFARAPIEERALAEARQALRCLSLRFNLLRDDGQGSLLDRALEERRERSVDRVYRLLGLVFPWRDVTVARRGMEGDARAHARAAEYLDNLLKGPLRRWLMPLLEEAPLEEKARKANALLRTRVRDPEDTLAQLVHDDDEALAAAAIQRVEEKGLWRLADDLEHVLEHRPARDWLVFETASWALAARRMPVEARRSRWREALPAVVAADRLRKVPLLRFASVGQLLRIAGAGRTTRPESGCLLYGERSAATRVQLLLEGPIAVQVGDASAVERSAPQALGLEAVLGGDRQRETVWTGDGAVCLTVGARDLLAQLAEDAALVRRLFRALLEDSSFDARVLRARPARRGAGHRGRPDPRGGARARSEPPLREGHARPAAAPRAGRPRGHAGPRLGALRRGGPRRAVRRGQRRGRPSRPRARPRFGPGPETRSAFARRWRGWRRGAPAARRPVSPSGSTARRSSSFSPATRRSCRGPSGPCSRRFGPRSPARLNAGQRAVALLEGERLDRLRGHQAPVAVRLPGQGPVCAEVLDHEVPDLPPAAPDHLRVAEHGVAGGARRAVVVERDPEGLVVPQGRAAVAQVLHALARRLSQVDVVLDPLRHVEVVARDRAVHERPVGAGGLRAGPEVPRGVLEGLAHHPAVALDRVELVVVDVQRGELARRHSAARHAHPRVEERREAHVGPRVVHLHLVDRVHEGGVLEAAACPGELGRGLGHRLVEVPLGGLVVGPRQLEDLRVGRGVGLHGEEPARRARQLPRPTGLPGERQVHAGHVHGPVARLHEQDLSHAAALLAAVRVAVDDRGQLRELLRDLPDGVLARQLAGAPLAARRVAVEAPVDRREDHVRLSLARAPRAPAARPPRARATTGRGCSPASPTAGSRRW